MKRAYLYILFITIFIVLLLISVNSVFDSKALDINSIIPIQNFLLILLLIIYLEIRGYKK